MKYYNTSLYTSIPHTMHTTPSTYIIPNLTVNPSQSDHASDSDLTFEPSSVSSQPTWQRSQSSMSLDTHRTKNRSLTLSERTTSNSHGQCHDSVAEHSKVCAFICLCLFMFIYIYTVKYR